MILRNLLTQPFLNIQKFKINLENEKFILIPPSLFNNSTMVGEAIMRFWQDVYTRSAPINPDEFNFFHKATVNGFVEPEDLASVPKLIRRLSKLPLMSQLAIECLFASRNPNWVGMGEYFDKYRDEILQSRNDYDHNSEIILQIANIVAYICHQYPLFMSSFKLPDAESLRQMVLLETELIKRFVSSQQDFDPEYLNPTRAA